jgi:sulfur-oxidizing protein SoxZ
MTLARVQWPDPIRAGDVVKVRLLIQHPMDTGYLQDLTGHLVPRNVIRQLTCTLGPQVVLRVEPSSGIASNPYFEFYLRAVETAEFRAQWWDDRGLQGVLTQTLKVG